MEKFIHDIKTQLINIDKILDKTISIQRVNFHLGSSVTFKYDRNRKILIFQIGKQKKSLQILECLCYTRKENIFSFCRKRDSSGDNDEKATWEPKSKTSSYHEFDLFWTSLMDVITWLQEFEDDISLKTGLSLISIKFLGRCDYYDQKKRDMLRFGLLKECGYLNLPSVVSFIRREKLLQFKCKGLGTLETNTNLKIFGVLVKSYTTFLKVRLREILVENLKKKIKKYE